MKTPTETVQATGRRSDRARAAGRRLLALAAVALRGSVPPPSRHSAAASPSRDNSRANSSTASRTASNRRPTPHGVTSPACSTDATRSSPASPAATRTPHACSPTCSSSGGPGWASSCGSKPGRIRPVPPTPLPARAAERSARRLGRIVRRKSNVGENTASASRCPAARTPARARPRSPECTLPRVAHDLHHALMDRDHALLHGAHRVPYRAGTHIDRNDPVRATLRRPPTGSGSMPRRHPRSTGRRSAPADRRPAARTTRRPHPPAARPSDPARAEPLLPPVSRSTAFIDSGSSSSANVVAGSTDSM
jgi:hypothetical protein